jgi:N-acetylglucosamine malate deacetylase 1
MNKVAIIAVHPDDETLGCGGTILKHRAKGDQINWIIGTDMKESDGFNTKQIKTRDDEISKVGSLYGFNSIHKLGFSTTKVDKYPISEIISKISLIFNEIQPNIIYLPYSADIHSDHQLIFNAAISCTKSFRYPFIKSIYMMETISETEFANNIHAAGFMPNVFNDITDFMDQKIQIMNEYKNELGKHPFPRNERNIISLATFRGASSGCDLAESFMLIKEIK